MSQSVSCLSPVTDQATTTKQPDYSSKLAEAESIIIAHNTQLPDDATKLSWSTIISKLCQLGGTTEAALANVTWEDLQDCGVPKILARQIANNIFRQASATKQQSVSPKRVAAMTYRELFENYDKTLETNGAVADRLVKESGGKRCVVLNHKGGVDVVTSERLLRDLKAGLPERDIVMSTEGPIKVHKPGEQISKPSLDENPLWPGEVLWADQSCPHTLRSWMQTPTVVRQVVFLACDQTKELNIANNQTIANSVLDIVLVADEAAIRTRFPRASVLLDELVQHGRAPTLRLHLKDIAKTDKNNPFYSHKRT